MRISFSEYPQDNRWIIIDSPIRCNQEIIKYTSQHKKQPRTTFSNWWNGIGPTEFVYWDYVSEDIVRQLENL